ncbi:MAG: hypothetical protein HYX49_00960 [Chloroflexi bacterium]|nr:hypothetical protein [Chloroflexota bacterium]
MRTKIFLFLILIASLLSACGLAAETGTPTAAPTDTPTALPTLTPTPAVPLAILVLPTNMNKAESDAFQKVVYDLAQQAGMRFQVRNSLSPADLEPGLQVVIALPPDPGIAALAAAAPQVQFLAINIPGISAGGNVSILASTTQLDVTAFLAGYIAALVSDDYRTGMIVPKDNPNAQKAMAAFSTGMTFYCGLCRPFYYVPYTFPQFAEIPADEDPNRFGGWVNYLVVDRKAYTLYVYPDSKIATQQLFDYIGTSGAQVIGVSLPNPKPSGWVVTLRPDEIKAIQSAWPGLIAGQGGQSVQAPLGLGDVDASVLTPGKLRLVQQVLGELQAGRISTGVTP